jgi:hypothetical protein
MAAPTPEMMDMSATWSKQEDCKLFPEVFPFSGSSRIIAEKTFAGIFLPLLFLWPNSCLLWMHHVTLQDGFHSW